MRSAPLPVAGSRMLRTPWLRWFPWDKVKGGWRIRQLEFEIFEWRAARWIAQHAASVVSGSGQVPRFGKIAGPDLSGVDVVLLDGHHAPLARSAALAARGSVTEVQRGTGATKGVPVVIDAGSHKPVFDEVFPLASDVICSGDYAYPSGLATGDLLALGPELVAVSHGGDPLVWWAAGTSGSISPQPVKAVDTLSAGDVLHGAYCFGLATGLGRPEALTFAVAAASSRVRHLGPFAWRDALRDESE